MSPEEEKKETQEPQKNAESDGTSTPEDLEAIKARLEEEMKAKAAAEAALAEKDTRIAELQAEGEAISKAHAQAVAKYLEAARALNYTVPKDVIAGGTIEEIDASVEKAKAIAEAVKKALEAQAKEAKVPAGAPTRGTINLEGLSPREKIAAGLNQKGGTS
jgi:type I site-specific restriction endonuclease